MANPVIVALTNNTWIKVATAVTSGNLYIANTTHRKLYITYRVTGDDAPTDLVDAKIYEGKEQFIDSTEEIDVYVQCSSRSGLDGSIRVAV